MGALPFARVPPISVRVTLGSRLSAALSLLPALAALGACKRPLPMHDGKTQAERLRDLALAKSRAHDWVREHADGGCARLAGSPGDAKAVAWAKAKMAAVGLADVHTEPGTVPHWERG